MILKELKQKTGEVLAEDLKGVDGSHLGIPINVPPLLLNIHMLWVNILHLRYE